MDIWSYMEREVESYRESLREDSSFHQDEADAELWLTLIRRLNDEPFTLFHKRDRIPYDGVNGRGENVSLNEMWQIVRRTSNLEKYMLSYKGKDVEFKNSNVFYQRFGDFAVFVCKELNIPYKV